jgi:anti-sigma regulatory factor (Ser/Thr protein kinase)
VKGLLGSGPESRDTIDVLLTELQRFTGSDHEQEDDITLVTLSWSSHAKPSQEGPPPPATRELAAFEIPSEPGNEQIAMERIADAVGPLGLPAEVADRLRTAVSEATMNAIEHGNKNRPELAVGVSAVVTNGQLVIRIADQGSEIVPDAPTPDLDLKLAGLQNPRGWGLFLIRNMVDDLRQHLDDGHHTLELVVELPEGENDGSHAL